LSLRSLRWSIKDKVLYEVLIDHLSGFNDALVDLLPETLRGLVSTALQATVLAENDETALSEIEQVAGRHPELHTGL
jgi:hypothetical protein